LGDERPVRKGGTGLDHGLAAKDARKAVGTVRPGFIGLGKRIRNANPRNLHDGEEGKRGQVTFFEAMSPLQRPLK